MSLRRGNDEAGFEIRVEENLLFLTCWGIYDQQLAIQQQIDMLATMDKFGGKPWAVVADLSRYPIQPPQVSAVIKSTMAQAKARGHQAGATVVSQTLTKMQIRRMAQESNTPEVNFFTDVPAATAWVKQLLAKGP